MLKSTAFLVAYLSATASYSAVTFLEPTPYRSQADSPFPVDAASFYFEDFEDGELNSLGVFQPVYTAFGSAFHGTVVSTNGVADSVDGDDGTVDGVNSNGKSFRSGWHLEMPTIPLRNQFVLDFDFDVNELSALPNSVGFALTDMPHGGDHGGLASLTLHVNDSLGQLWISPSLNVANDGSRSGGVADDFFYGVTGVIAGITRLTILGGTVGDFTAFEYFEVDHLQYGFLVPEPAAWMLFAIGVTILRRRRVA